ncbi:DedA family protein [Litchfieldia alkalitelluris]|uniref:DedA family protein n=1 Tax=Litchfieldia alkalitelluris TaxID=304268 RepID=UPI000997F168|nr:DedA family protein [Litchfieldia alkalitelluris]
MELEAIVDSIEQYGYFGLFLWLWIGVLGIPIPNEVIIMTVGYAGSVELFNPFLLYLCAFFGLIAANTTSFLLGHLAGKPLLTYLNKKKRTKRTIERSMTLIDRYRTFSLVVSYFIPGLRTMVPFLFGLSGLRYYKFASISYSTIFIWTSIYFLLGSFGLKLYMEVPVGLTFGMILFIVSGLIVLITVKHKRRVKLKGEI